MAIFIGLFVSLLIKINSRFSDWSLEKCFSCLESKVEKRGEKYD